MLQFSPLGLVGILTGNHRLTQKNTEYPEVKSDKRALEIAQFLVANRLVFGKSKSSKVLDIISEFATLHYLLLSRSHARGSVSRIVL